MREASKSAADPHQSLRSIDVLVVDCQASGATPAHGDLLELAWACCGERGVYEPIRGHWIKPRTERPIPRAVRELTGWSEARVAESLDEHEAWSQLRISMQEHGLPERAPTLIHFARFETPFLRDLHARLEAQAEFPFEIRCLHAIAIRLFPDLPRLNIRALSGFLGHSAELTRSAHGHALASAFIWRALLPHLEAQGVTTWSELTAWLDKPAAKGRRGPGQRVYPLALERRRSLPDRPGVYRFLRSNTSVLYVGKAASLKKRIAGHFSRRGPSTERGLELLSQVHDIAVTETASVLEAALLETDEIKRIDPPYNVQLRKGERHAWFASTDLQTAQPSADPGFVLGPLPSERALISLAALCALVSGEAPTKALCAMALAVPSAYLPDPELFALGFQGFLQNHLANRAGRPRRRTLMAARALFVARGRSEPTSASEDAEPDAWDLARVHRRLERALISGGLLVRRAALLRLLADCEIAYREASMTSARSLVVVRGQLAASDLARVDQLRELPRRSKLSAAERRACFDAATYDRLRVLTTELLRVLQEGGEVALRVGGHVFEGQRLRGLFGAI
ncbi:MAG: GIY-YIG nuclease family protein [Polyangiales bacterium]